VGMLWRIRSGLLRSTKKIWLVIHLNADNILRRDDRQLSRRQKLQGQMRRYIENLRWEVFGFQQNGKG
jgi:hypothetical protein